MATKQPQLPPPGFAADIKPLFTKLDRDHMMVKLDVWKYDDVKASAGKIYETLRNQIMPPRAANLRHRGPLKM